MLYEKSRNGALTKEEFQNPGKEYRGAPFWALNGKLTKEEAARQIAVFDQMGFGGYNLHSRTGLQIPYLGEEFFDFIRYAVEEGKKRGMYSWLYDEDRYPSGAAGGLVTKDLAWRARCMLLTAKPQEGYCESREAFEQAVREGQKPRGYYVTSYEICLEDGYLKEYRRITREAALSHMEAMEREGRPAAGRQIRMAYVRLSPESPWYNDCTYLDTLNPQAVDRFIQVTHEAYAREVGKEFGTWIPAIFTDEPQMAGKYALTFADSAEDATIAFTDDLDDTFRKTWGVSLLDILPEILWELPGGAVSVHRYHYHDHVAERFARAFPDNLASWCEEHRIALTGHFMSERTLYSQTLALGEAMRCYRAMQLPGIDNLCDAKEFTTAKQAVSVARQKGREGVLSEIYGATHWDFDFIGHKLQGDWQAALGITVRVHHLSFYTMEGEAKRDWPASISFQSPWYQKYHYIEDHFARVNTALTRGKPLARVGVIHPIESFWISYGPCDQTQLLRDKLDENFVNLTEWLVHGLVDFDFLSESMLPGQCVCGGQPSMQVGEMEYEAVLVPSLRTIRNTTLDILERFAAAGGRVIFAGEIPKLVDAKPSDRAEKLAARCARADFARYDILESLRDFRDLEVLDAGGRPAGGLAYQMRKEAEKRWLFLCHSDRKENRADVPENYRIRLRGRWEPTLYDTLTGEIRKIPAKLLGEETWLAWTAYGQDSMLLALEPAAAKRGADRDNTTGQRDSMPDLEPVTAVPAIQKETRRTLMRPDRVRFSEPNALLLDAAEYAVNEEPFQGPAPILEIDNLLRDRFGWPRRRDAVVQPWCMPPEPEPENQVTLRFRIPSKAALQGVRLAAEETAHMRASLNGREFSLQTQGWYVDPCLKTALLPEIQKGENVLTVTLPFGRKTNLEWMYLLGDFQVDLKGCGFVLREEKEISFGDLTRQGRPFYTGNTVYEIPFDTEETGSWVLEIPQFAGTLMEVETDGKPAGLVCFAPYRISLGTLDAGPHRVSITLYGNRFNGFGTLHNADKDYKWYGPDSYRTDGSQYTDSYLVKPAGILSGIYLYREGDCPAGFRTGQPLLRQRKDG